MKYMTFNSSCSYAGIANMLEQYGIDTTDRTIALAMKLPYLFAYKNGAYMAGPMLQSAEWFNLFLHPLGFDMVECEIPAIELPKYLKQQKTAMLGLQVSNNDKHAVVYIGTQDSKLVFLNNKWEHDPAPAQLILSDAELSDRIKSSAVVATLVRIDPRKIDLHRYMSQSIPTIQRNLAEIKALCFSPKTVGELRSVLNSLFRPLFLDSITMLKLLGENDLAEKLSNVQQKFLNALRQNSDTAVVLKDHIPINVLEEVANGYVTLIAKEMRVCEKINHCR